MWPAIRNAAIVLLLSAIAAEGALRVAAFLPLGHAAFVADPEIGLRMRSDWPSADRLGFRGGESALVDGAQIAFIGDSFVYGIPELGPSTAELTGALLGRKTANLGVPGSGPPEYEKVARVYGGAPSIRLLVVGIYVGNDVHQSRPGQATVGYAGSLYTLPPPWRFDQPLDQWYLSRAVAFGLRWLTPACPATSPYLARLAGAESRLYRPDAARAFDSSYANLGDILARIRARARAHGAELLAVVQPTQFQVDPAYAAAIAACLGKTAGDFDPQAPSRRLMREFAARDLPALDLTQRFAAAGGTGLYIPGDSHWSDAGNRLAAETIAGEIRRRFGL